MKTIYEYQPTADSSESNGGTSPVIPFEQVVVNGIRCWVENPNASSDSSVCHKSWEELPDKSWQVKDAS